MRIFYAKMKFLIVFLIFMSSADMLDDALRSKVRGYIEMLHSDQAHELSVFSCYDELHQDYRQWRHIVSVLTDLLPTPPSTVTVLTVIVYCAMVYAIVQFRRELITIRQENKDAAQARADLENRLRDSQEVSRFLLGSLHKMRSDINSLPCPATPVPFDPEPFRAEYWDQYRYLYALINDRTEALDRIIKDNYEIHGSAYYFMQQSIDFLMSEYYRSQKVSVEMSTQTSEKSGLPRGILKTYNANNSSKKSVHFSY